MTYRKRETFRDFARYMAHKYEILDRLKKQDEQRKQVEDARRAEQPTR